MRLGCSTFVFDVVNDTRHSPADRMQLIRDAGFDGVEYTQLDRAAAQDAVEREFQLTPV